MIFEDGFEKQNFNFTNQMNIGPSVGGDGFLLKISWRDLTFLKTPYIMYTVGGILVRRLCPFAIGVGCGLLLGPIVRIRRDPVEPRSAALWGLFCTVMPLEITHDRQDIKGVELPLICFSSGTQLTVQFTRSTFN
jgi:hypothetical protein